MEQFLLGIDIGTSACKAAVFRPDGTVAAQASAAYPVHYPGPGQAEQQPEDWWNAVCCALHTLFDKGVKPGQICGIGVDGQSWSAIAMDASGNVLCPTPIWMDTRSEGICRRMRESCGEDRLFRVSGNPVQPMYTMPKVLWYKEKRPDVYQDATKILQSNGFIAYRLTGVMCQDLSQGYGWNCFDMARCTWDYDTCRDLGCRVDLLPELTQCHQIIGVVTPQAAVQTGLLAGTPVVAGGLDAACGTLGVGVVSPGQTQEQGGQAGGMSICTDRCTPDPRLILSTHVVPDLWLLQGGTVGGSGCLKWFEQEFGAAERALAQQSGFSSFEELSRLAAVIPAGSDGLVFLPYMAGERSPVWDADAKGVFYGMDFSKTRGHFVRAVMEGVAYSLQHNLETAEAAGAKVGEMYAMGGAANSQVWTQLKADITGKRILVPQADTATALGAAILAGVGTGVYSDFQQAVEKTVRIQRYHTPFPENQAVYDHGYRTYRALYENLKQLMKEATT